MITVASAGALLHFGKNAPVSKGPQATAAKRNVSSISLPMFFEPNQGQTAPQVKFLARGSGYGLFLTANEAVLEVQHSAVSSQQSALSSQVGSGTSKLAARGSQLEAPVTSIIRMHLEGANPTAKIAGSGLLPGKSNYFIGSNPTKWRRNIPQYARVNYQAVYPGVDLVYYGNEGQLEYDFRVAPGADPSQIALKFDGASPRLENGDLVLSTRAGDVRFHAPNIYQQDGGSRRAVEGRFRQRANNEIGFTIGPYDHNRELVIDPILFYSTYLGGTGTNPGESLVHIAVDLGSNMYVSGSTTSKDFPTFNPFQAQNKGTQNIFIAKLNEVGTALDYATYLGGSQIDSAAGVSVDAAFNVYVAGSTTSPDFPTSANAFQGATSGTHGFISKLDPTGSSLLYSTYLAGNGADQVTSLAVDNSADAFVTGITSSTNDVSNGFPATANGYQTASNGGTFQFFASRINTNGAGFSSMLYSTYFGGGYPVGAHTSGGGIAADTNGNIYITGGTDFIGVLGPQGQKAFPIRNAQQGCLNQIGQNTCQNPAPPGQDAFVAKINTNVVGDTSLVYSTYVGGSGDDIGNGIAVDGTNSAYFTGSTNSPDFIPSSLLTLAFQECLNNTNTAPPCASSTNTDAFVGKIGNPSGSSTTYPLNYATYIGGSQPDVGFAVAVDNAQGVRVTGATSSPDLPVLDELDQQSGGYGGSGDAFVALISTTGSGRAAGDYLTFLGGSGFDQGTGVALDSSFATYVAGETQSSTGFPVGLNPPFQATLKGGQNAFVAKITNKSSFAYATTNPLKVSPSPANMGVAVTVTFNWTNSGETAYNVSFSGQLSGFGPGQGISSVTAQTSPGGTCNGYNGTTGALSCPIGTVPASSAVSVTVTMTPTCASASQGSQCPSTVDISSPTLSFTGGSQTFTTCPNGPPCPLPVTVDDFTISVTPASQSVTAGGSTSYTVSLTPCSPQGSLCIPGGSATYTSPITMSQTITPTTSTITTSYTTNPVTISGSGTATTTLNLTTQPRPVGSGSLWHRGPIYATWIPVGGLSLLGLGVGASRRRRRWIAGGLLGLIAGILLLQAACGNSSSNPASTGGTPAGTYFITVTGTSGSAAHSASQVQLVVQ